MYAKRSAHVSLVNELSPFQGRSARERGPLNPFPGGTLARRVVGLESRTFDQVTFKLPKTCRRSQIRAALTRPGQPDRKRPSLRRRRRPVMVGVQITGTNRSPHRSLTPDRVFRNTCTDFRTFFRVESSRRRETGRHRMWGWPSEDCGKLAREPSRQEPTVGVEWKFACEHRVKSHSDNPERELKTLVPRAIGSSTPHLR